MSDVIGGTPAAEDPLAADKAALAEAQARLAADQQDHAEKLTALNVATATHATAAAELASAQSLLAEAQAKLEADTAALEAKAKEVASTVVAATASAVSSSVISEAETHLNDAEAIALKWGGDIGTDLRNLVGKLKTLFGLSASTTAATTTAAAPEAAPAATGTSDAGTTG